MVIGRDPVVPGAVVATEAMPAAFVVAVNVDPLNVNVTVLPATGVEPALSVADNVIGVLGRPWSVRCR